MNNKTILILALSLILIGGVLFIIPLLSPLNFLPLLGFLFYTAGIIWLFNSINKEDNIEVSNFHDLVKEVKEQPKKEVNILEGVI